MMAGHRKETPGKRDRSLGAAKGSRVQSGPLKSMYGSRSTRSAAPLRMTSDPEERPPTSTRAKLKLDFSEVRGDLFSCPRTASLVHCVSEDMAMGRGIAKEFKKQFGGIQELKGQGVKTGGVAVLKRGNRYIYYLVTKPRYFHKPTYDTLHSSLVALREQCINNGITELCMPQIGCGLDKLEWDKVKGMIQDIFADFKISITVYAL